MTTGFDKLNKEVISVGLCTDCGNCAGICPSRSLAMNYETELPELVGKCVSGCELCSESCPGKDIPMLDLDEVVFGRERSGGEELNIGIAQKFLKGHAVDANIRAHGSGGGLATSLLVYALDKKIINGVIVAAMSDDRPWRVVPRIATNREEIIAASQAKEALVPINSLLSDAVRKGITKLGFVGLPCHVQAIRKMQMYGRPKEIIDPIKVVVGLFCGHNWTWRATQHIITELAEIPVDQVAKLEYRAGEYPGEFAVTSKSGKVVKCPMKLRRITLAGYANDRCTMCYDYANDLADVSVGDYWAIEMTKGAPRMSAAVVRTDAGKKLLEDAEGANYIHTETISSDNCFQGLYELKKHGGAHHTLERKRFGWAVPNYHLPLDEKILWRNINLTHPQLG